MQDRTTGHDGYKTLVRNGAIRKRRYQLWTGLSVCLYRLGISLPNRWVSGSSL